MPTLDKDVSYVSADRVELMPSARDYINEQRAIMEREFPEDNHVAVVNLGIEGLWIAFSSRSLLANQEPYISDDAVAYAIPLRLDDGEQLVIDLVDNQLALMGVDLQALIPTGLRRAFLLKLEGRNP